ncbi:MAG: methyltransferase type 11 [Lachnospiraceae bacterium]|nr:methyltransferase type 11 [Lachnospiraceae bacterium]
MHNPWEDIDLNDYESHMSLDSVYQLQVLSQIMKEQFYSYDVKNIMILGIAGGNGLEHIDKNRFTKVYGVDVNRQFLQESRERYRHLEDVYETICTDLLRDELQLPTSELLIANLLVEYIGYQCFQKVVKLVGPRYISCTIQINTGKAFVSDSPYLHAFDNLEQVHHQMEENALVDSLQEFGFRVIKRTETRLPNEKKFLTIDFGK